MTHVVVIGGGIAGLAAALELGEAAGAPAVTVVESSERFGGKIATSRAGGLVIEAGAEAILSVKPAALALCHRLGISDRLINTRLEDRRTFVYSKGALRPLPEGLIFGSPARAGSLLRAGLVSPAGFARMALEAVVPARRDGAEESIAAFFTRRLGAEAYQRVVEPLMAGIHAGDAHQLSLPATFPRFVEMEHRHGGLVRAAVADSRAARRRRRSGAAGTPGGAGNHTPFVSLRTGLADLVDTLVARLRSLGVTLLAGTPVTAVHPTPAGPAAYRVELATAPAGGAAHLDADGVVLAAPAPATAALLARLSPTAAEILSSIPHASTATVSLAYRSADLAVSPAGYGFVVPRAEGRDLLAATWSSSKWEGRAPAGQVLVRGYVGGVGREAVLAGDDEALVGVVRRELAALAGLDAAPVYHEVHRFPDGMPQYTLGHTDRVARVRAELSARPGLAVTGAAYGGVGIPDCIVDATRTAGEMLARLRRPG